MRQVIAIGGGGFGRTQASNLIEQYILDQSTKNTPISPDSQHALGIAAANKNNVLFRYVCLEVHGAFKKTNVCRMAIQPTKNTIKIYYIGI